MEVIVPTVEREVRTGAVLPIAIAGSTSSIRSASSKSRRIERAAVGEAAGLRSSRSMRGFSATYDRVSGVVWKRRYMGRAAASK